MMNYLIKKQGFSLIEILITIGAISLLSLSVWKVFNWANGDSKLLDSANFIQILGNSLTPDNISFYGTDVVKMEKDGIIPSKYVRGNKIYTPLGEEVRISIENDNLALTSHPDFKSSGKSKLKTFKIKYKVDGENCNKFYALTHAPYQYITQESGGQKRVLKNDIKLKNTNYSAKPDPNGPECNPGINNEYTYVILFKDRN